MTSAPDKPDKDDAAVESPHNSRDEHASDHDHDHGHGDEDDSTFPEVILRNALAQASSGLRSDVQELLDLLADSHVYIPLSEDLPDAPEGKQIELDGDLTFRPHMILGEDEAIFAVAYSDPSLCDAMQKSLGWTTSGGDLKFICVPADVALDLAQVTIDGQGVSGLVFNPGTDEELVLRRDEVASFSQGVAIPLVGYVSELGPDDEEAAQVVEGAAPPPQVLLDALQLVQKAQADLLGFNVSTTFDPERDREPHLTITLIVTGRHDLNRPALADLVMDEVGEHIPPPGYADIVFRDAPN